MIRSNPLALIILGLAVVSANATDTTKLSCTGVLIEPAGIAQTPKTLKFNIGPDQKISLDLGQGSSDAQVESDNKVQLKFSTKEFEGEYFHYSGDLFLIHKSGKLTRMTCKKADD